MIVPGQQPLLAELKELVAFREIVYFLMWRDFKVRYRQTYLGVLWAVLQPLMATGIFSIFLGGLIGMPSGGIPYPLFVLSALIFWNSFARGVANMATALVADQDLVKRIYFPRLAIPLASMGSAMVDLVPGLVILGLAMAAYGVRPPPQLILLPICIPVLGASALGLGLLASAIHVRYRDIGHLVPFMLQLLLFASPVLYASEVVPAHWRALYGVNPAAGLLDMVRWCLFDTPVALPTVASSLVSAALLLAAGLAYFTRAERHFPDYI